MILSVSRRTDIPAFYSDWFLNRMKSGYVLVRNPINRKQVHRVSLNPKDIECIVFWTKDPSRMLSRLDELDRYKYYFQVTITSYGKDVEAGIASKKDIIKSFVELSKRIGKEKTVWRYDPILLSDKYTEAYHYEYFEMMADKMAGYTEKCVISFIDTYAKTEKNLKGLNLKHIASEDMRRISKNLAEIGKRFNMDLEACSEAVDLESYGVRRGKCIDDRLISKIVGFPGKIPKDPNQREGCGCVKSVDVGIYNTCPHRCAYCYANAGMISAGRNYESHRPDAELLFGELIGDETIIEKEASRYFEQVQLELFDLT